MNITYTKPIIANNDVTVSVTFSNEEGNVYSRLINVPYKNGVLDDVEWDKRLEEHLRSVKYKAELGFIVFVSEG